jgi:purine-cytosine permease-like protein
MQGGNMKDFLFEILIYLIILSVALLITVFTGFNVLHKISLITEIASFTVVGVVVLAIVILKLKSRKKN